MHYLKMVFDDKHQYSMNFIYQRRRGGGERLRESGNPILLHIFLYQAG